MTQKNNAGSKNGSSSEHSLQHALQMGAEASKMLSSPLYNVMYQEKMRELHDQWLSSEPKEERKRESLYWQARGLIELTENMGELVTQAQVIMQSQSDAENAQTQQYLDEQGFGPA